MPARSADVDGALSTMEPDHLACRYRRHAWDPYTARAVPGGYAEVLVCTRCGTRRHTVLTRRFAVASVRYDYPDGYLVTGLGQLTGEDRDRLRRAVILPLVGEG